MKKISLVIPMYNEEAMVSLLFSALEERIINAIKASYEIEVVCVNDGSKDKTLELLKEEQTKHPYLTIVNLSRNWGQEAAVRAGLLTASGDCVIPMDADLQDPPEIIPEMLKMWEDGYEVVNAIRVSRKKDTAFKRNSAGIFYRYLDKISPKVMIPSNVNNFRLLDRRVVDEVNALSESNRVLRVEIPFVGFKTGAVEIVRAKRAKGESHYPLGAMVKLAKDSIVSVSVKPLDIGIKVAIALGIMFCLSAVAELVLFILQLCNVITFMNDLALWMWLVINVLLLVSTLIVGVLAVHGLYLGKIAEESAHRPSVIIKEVIKK